MNNPQWNWGWQLTITLPAPEELKKNIPQKSDKRAEFKIKQVIFKFHYETG